MGMISLPCWARRGSWGWSVICHPDIDAVIERLKKASDNARLRYDFEYDLPSFQRAMSVADGILRAVKPSDLRPVVWVGDHVTNHPD